LKGVYKKIMVSMKYLEINFSYNYPWKDHIVRFLKTSNGLIFSKKLCLDTHTKVGQFFACTKSWS
jgi:hypothetical protein